MGEKKKDGKRAAAMLAPMLLFGLSMLSVLLEKDKDSNVIFSPFSAHQALSIVGEGSTGKTRAELLGGLQAAGKSFEAIALEQEPDEKAPRVLGANSVWVRAKTTELFAEKAKTYQSCELRQVPGSTGTAELTKQINAWCASKTNNMIRAPVHPEDVGKAVMLIVNALYFKGEWASHFKPDHSGTKWVGPGDASTVEFMHQKLTTRYYKDSSVEAIELPYAHSNWTARILLPAESHTLASVADKATFERVEAGLKRQEVRLTMPSFSFRSELNLIPPLQAMGVHRLFEPHGAELNQLIDDDSQLYVHLVKQVAKIDFTRTGTEAAAVTVVAVMRAAIMIPSQAPIPAMTVDRPFLVVISDPSNHPVFIGAINHPDPVPKEKKEKDEKKEEKEKDTPRVLPKHHEKAPVDEYDIDDREGDGYYANDDDDSDFEEEDLPVVDKLLG